MDETPVRKGKTIAVYLASIAVALIGLALILRAGEGLEAPQALGGSWRILAEDRSTVPSSCNGAFPRAATTMAITQSGVFVSIAFDDPGFTGIEGRLDGGVLRANGPQEGAEISIMRASDRATLHVTWRVPRRPECSAAFRAVQGEVD